MSNNDQLVTKPSKSFGPMQSRSLTEPSFAVHGLVDRFENLFPRHVSMVPSVALGVIVSCVIFSLLAILAKRDKQLTRNSEDALIRYRHVMAFVVAIAVSYLAGKTAFNVSFLLASYNKNEQHFANVYWLKRYAVRRCCRQVSVSTARSDRQSTRRIRKTP